MNMEDKINVALQIVRGLSGIQPLLEPQSALLDQATALIAEQLKVVELPPLMTEKAVIHE